MSAMREPKQPVQIRRWFQFHLATAMLLMLVAGVLVWVNMRVRPVSDDIFLYLAYSKSPRIIIDDRPMRNEAGEHGWPWTGYRWFKAYHNFFEFSMIYKSSICLNIIFGVGSLLAIAVICEWLIRRKRKS